MRRTLALCAALLASGCGSPGDDVLSDAVVACAPTVDAAVSHVQEGFAYTTVLRQDDVGVIVGATMPQPRWRPAASLAFHCLADELGAPDEVRAMSVPPPASGVESWSEVTVQWTWDAEDGFSAVFTEF